MQADRPMIEVKDLTKLFGAVTALDRISFEVQAGQIVGFLGPNGAGKTTTLRILTGYVPADDGAARIAGHDVFTDSRRVRQHIGYLPESTPLYNDMRVHEYLRYRARLKGVGARDVERSISEVAERCWVSDFINRLIGQLSKGMRQRVGLADALIHDPDILFLDEPTIGLDPTQIRQTRDLIAELARKHTVMLSSHILSDIEALCSHVVIIASGRVVASGNPRKLSTELSQSSKLIAEISGPQDAVTTAIHNIAGVKSVDATADDGWCRLVIESEPHVDIREVLFKLTADNGWSLREMRREVGSLEDYFVRIVAQQQA